MSRIHCILSLVLVTIICQTTSAASWDSLGQAWQQYRANPTPAFAESLYNSLPERTNEPSIDADPDYVVDSIYENLGFLAGRIEDDDRGAVRVAFRMFTISDDDFWSWLEEMLGNLIRIDPQMFLEELKNHHELVPSVGGLTSNFGPEFTESPVILDQETKFRIEALQSVTVDTLASVRDECIEALKGNLWWKNPDEDKE